MSSSVHVDNKKKYFLILGKGPTQGLGSTTFYILLHSTEFLLKFL